MVLVKWEKDGSYRPYWYMRVRRLDDPTKTKDIKTDVPVKGTPPASRRMRDLGDDAFEKSRHAAEAKADQFLTDRKEKGASDHLLRQLYKDKTGREPEYVRLDELADLWKGLAREQAPSEKRMKASTTVFNRFAAYCAVSDVHYLYEVTPELVTGFFNIIKGHLAWSTVKDQMCLLTGAFKRFLPHGLPTPFGHIIKRSTKAESRRIHKAALTEDKLPLIFEEAKRAEEDYLYPITVCAACTGMRIGDVCKLRWEHISADNHIQVTTSKAGIFVNIPIFPELQKVIDGLIVTKDPSEPLVFPDAAVMYEHNPSGVYRRGKKLFANALFPKLEEEPDVTEVMDGEPVPDLTPEEVFEVIDGAGYAPKKTERMKEVYRRRIAGESYLAIARALNKSKGQVSGDLTQLEELTKLTLRPSKNPNSLAKRLKKTRTTRPVGKNAVSIYGWHSFRATFATTAKRCGVSDDAIIQIIGHTTFKTTENYIDYKAMEADRELEKMSGTAIGLGYKARTALLPSEISDEDLLLLKAIKALTPEKRALALSAIPPSTKA